MNRHFIRSLLLTIAVSMVPLLSAVAGDKGKKATIPSEAAQAEALKVVKEVYGDEYAKAETLLAKRAVAKMFVEKARNTRDASPTSLFFSG